jgi:hypothetical protein
MQSNLAQIELSEELLRQAMLTSDVESLNALISPNLVFTTHFGSVISKQDDLEAHRSGALKFHAIELSEKQILAISDLMYVSVRARVTGNFGNSRFQDDIRFSRIWQQTSEQRWQVVFGQATAVQNKL